MYLFVCYWQIEWLKDRVQAIEPRILAFDIECTKARHLALTLAPTLTLIP